MTEELERLFLENMEKEAIVVSVTGERFHGFLYPVDEEESDCGKDCIEVWTGRDFSEVPEDEVKEIIPIKRRYDDDYDD